MATSWMKQCKSKALDDVVHHSHQYRRHSLLSHSSSCKNSLQNLKDIVETNGKQSKPPQTAPFKRPRPRKAEPPAPNRTRTRSSSNVDSFLPSLTELPEGHPSRNVVEIIFHTSWSDKAFPGRVEMVFKIQNPTRTAARFEEYRETIKLRARSADVAEGVEDHHARCVADGNEVMRFFCLGATSGGGACDVGVGAWGLNKGEGASAVCTYSGSGVAHESAGGGRGRRAMLVCRVVAGRVHEQVGFDSFVDSRVGYDSVSGENGKLLVFDSRALLPCFLIIYIL